MAPEQAEGKTGATDCRTDVYGLGAILYELLVGRPPFRADSPLHTLSQVLEVEPARLRLLNPAVPRDLETVCLKCLEKEPARRYPSGAALADDLERYLDNRPVQARPVGPIGRLRRWCRRNPVPATMAGVLVLSLVGGLSGILREWRRAEVARADAVSSNEAAQQLLTDLINTSPVIPLQGFFPYEGTPALEPLLRAKAQCESLLQRNPGDRALRIALTKVLGGLGTAYWVRGQLQDGAACFRSAHEQWQASSGEDSGGAECMDWLATTHRWLVYVENNPTRMLVPLLDADTIWESLADEQPTNLDLLRKVKTCRHDLLHLLEAQMTRKAAQKTLEANRTALTTELRERPESKGLARRLAITCWLLGDLYEKEHLPDQATACSEEAYQQFRQLGGVSANRLPPLLGLASCCTRLARAGAADAYYREAVLRLEQIDAALATSLREDPDNRWLGDLLLENRLALAVCHWKAGQRADGERIYNVEVRPLVDRLSERSADPRHGFRSLGTLLRLGSTLRLAGQPDAALVLTRDASAVASRYAAFFVQDPVWCEGLASFFVSSSALLNQLKRPNEALRHAEQARQYLEGPYWAAPDNPRYAASLSNAWQRIAKARWGLGQFNDALAAFDESTRIQRRLFEHDRYAPLDRLVLSRCYGRSAYYRGLRRDWTGAAAALQERARLAVKDQEELREVARDYQALADRVADPAEGRTPQGQEQARRFRIAGEQLLRQAEALTRKE
jgi:tetratricopeptide (TPR) repeat protein